MSESLEKSFTEMIYRIKIFHNILVLQVDIIELYLFNRYNQRRDSMIIGFKDKETERIFYRGYSRRLPTQAM